jgi:hypothetical protein
MVVRPQCFEEGALVRGVLIHNWTAEMKGIASSPVRDGMRIFGAGPVIDRILEIDPAPLDKQRPNEERLIGYCYHFALVHCALLRAKGVPSDRYRQTVEIRWLTAFIDMPFENFDLGTAFWQRVTGTRLSAPRGVEAQFATLIPPDGDSYLRVQRTPSGPRIHLDLHVESITDAGRTAEQLGALVDLDLGHVIMRSPTGMTFCLVNHHGESTRPAPVHQGMEHRLDQVCIDVPATLFEEETRFWQMLTGWELRQSQREEFAVLTQPATMPLRLLFQRLGNDDGAESSRAHLDVACGRHVDDVRELHEQFGAVFVTEGPVWTTMRDPAGMLYCLTQRDPDTGQLSG